MVEQETTQIQVTKDTALELWKLKQTPDDTYDTVIKQLLEAHKVKVAKPSKKG